MAGVRVHALVLKSSILDFALDLVNGFFDIERSLPWRDDCFVELSTNERRAPAIFLRIYSPGGVTACIGFRLSAGRHYHR